MAGFLLDDKGPAPLNSYRLDNNIQDPNLSSIYAANNISPMSTGPAPISASRINPAQSNAVGAIGAMQAGVQAGQNIVPTRSAGDAGMQAGSSALTGAAAGAVVGSLVPGIGTAVGAAVGGSLGLITGSINAYLSVKSERQKARDYERLVKEIKDREDKQRAQDLSIQSEQTRYNRKSAADQARIDAYTQVRNSVFASLATNQSLKDRMQTQGYI